jgi:negative regulator of sigma-B (phosphoserine phosphatase)
MSLIEWNVAQEALPGQKQSGDRCVVKTVPSGMLVAVVDGIGHGQDAAYPAELAVSALNRANGGSLISLLRSCQQQLQGTRGAVLSMALFNEANDTMTWLGVGNVEGVLIRREAYGGARQESLLLRGGVVGAQLPSISASVLPVAYGDMLIFATDGIQGGFADNLNINASTQEIAQNIIGRHWRKVDDALVVVARYVHKNESALR